jgi:hypothetical protein
MLTTVERKYLARIPCIANRRQKRISFMPIFIAFCAMTTILCLMSLFFHSTLPMTEATLTEGKTDSSVPPKSSKATTRIADEASRVSPMMIPFIGYQY